MKTRAAVLFEIGSSMSVVDIDIQEPLAGEALVEIAACGLCHSDLSVIDADVPVSPPIVLGHEAAGRVLAVGGGVDSDLVGANVLITPIPSCGACFWCVRHQPTLCERGIGFMTMTMPDGTTRLSHQGEPVFTGLGVAGFAEHSVVPVESLIRIPDDFDPMVAAVLGCAVQTGFGAVSHSARIQRGDSALVMGLGGVGMSSIQAARISGAEVIVGSDPLAHRRELALKLGATHVVDPAADDVVEVVRSLTSGRGIDFAFDSVGSSQLAASGIDAVRSGGTVVLVGAGKLEDSLTFDRLLFMIQEKRVVGSVLGSVSAAELVPRLVTHAREGQLDLDSLMTMRRPLTELNEAAADMRSGRGLRTLLIP